MISAKDTKELALECNPARHLLEDIEATIIAAAETGALNVEYSFRSDATLLSAVLFELDEAGFDVKSRYIIDDVVLTIDWSITNGEKHPRRPRG